MKHTNPTYNFQDVNLLVTYAHRRSCSILHRNISNPDNVETANKLKKLLDDQVDDASHDFDTISHSSCSYDKTEGLSIDVDKIIGHDDGVLTDEEYDDYYGDYEPDAELLDDNQV